MHTRELVVVSLLGAHGIAPERAQDLIMKARAHWFENTEHAE